MAKIKKIQESGETIYPATIFQAVKDPKSGQTLEKSFESEHKKLTAGFAYEILGDSQATAEKLSFRPTGGPNRNVRDGSARIEVLKGNSVVWNQPIGSLFIQESIGLSLTYDKGILTINGTATGQWFYGAFKTSAKNSEHIYLLNVVKVGGSYTKVSGGTRNLWLNNGYEGWGGDATGTNNWLIFKGSTDNYYGIVCNTGDVFENCKLSVKLHDLTQMFGAGNEPTTVEQFYEMMPEGVDINAYNDGEIVDANYKAIKTTGFNQWDEQWEVGSVDGTTGNKVFNNAAIRSKGYIRVIAGAKYNIKSPSQVILCAYDEDYNYIGWLVWGGSTTTFTIPVNAKYIRFGTYGALYGPTYNNDICINIAWDEYSALNGTYKPYKPFERDLSWVSKYFPNGMRSAGNVADEIRFNSTTQQWEAVPRVGVVDLGSLSWEKQDRPNSLIAWRFRAKIGDSVQSGTLLNVLCDKYIVDISPIGEEKVDDSIIMYNGYVYVEDTSYTDATSFTTAMAGVMLNYELAEPIVTPITEDVNLAYDVADYGTEQLIVAEGAQSAPLSAEVIYEPNVLASIKQVAAMLTRLDALETAVATMQAAVATTNEE